MLVVRACVCVCVCMCVTSLVFLLQADLAHARSLDVCYLVRFIAIVAYLSPPRTGGFFTAV